MEMPDLVEVGRTFADRGGEVVAISQDLFTKRATVESSLPKVQNVMQRLGMEFDVVVYDDDLEKLNDRFDLPGPIPATVAVNKAGKVVAIEEEGADLARLSELMELALAD